jgi:hypothetical protein
MNKIEKYAPHAILGMTIAGFSWLLYCMLATYMIRKH